MKFGIVISTRKLYFTCSFWTNCIKHELTHVPACTGFSYWVHVFICLHYRKRSFTKLKLYITGILHILFCKKSYNNQQLKQEEVIQTPIYKQKHSCNIRYESKGSPLVPIGDMITEVS